MATGRVRYVAPHPSRVSYPLSAAAAEASWRLQEAELSALRALFMEDFKGTRWSTFSYFSFASGPTLTGTQRATRCRRAFRSAYEAAT